MDLLVELGFLLVKLVGGGPAGWSAGLSTAQTIMPTACTTAIIASKRMLASMPKRRVMFVLLGCSGSCGLRVSKSGIWFLFHASSLLYECHTTQ